MSAHDPARWPRPVASLVVAAAALVSHLPALAAGFTQDDRDFFVRNTSLRSLSAALSAFGSAFPPNDPARGLYRPLTNLSYALDVALGPAPLLPHATNVLLYALAALLVHRLALALRFSPLAALAGALLFAVHPVHCEAVDSIAGRSELLSLVLTSAALGVYARADFAPTLAQGALAAGLYVLAAFSKESALVLPMVIGLACLARHVPEQRGRAWRVLPWASLVLLALAAVACFSLRAHALGRVTSATTILGEATLATRLWTLGAIVLEYARLLIAPSTLAPDFYYTHAVGIHHAPTLVPLLGLALLLALVVLLGRAIWRGSPHALGLAVLLGYLLPVSHVVPFGALMAERFLLLPSLGFALAFGLVFEQLVWRSSRVAVPALALLLVALSARSFARALEWRDEVTLWTPVAEQIENDFRVYNNLALGYLERGDVAHATPLLQRSLELAPDNRVALSNLGQVLMNGGALEAARELYGRALRKSPDYALGHTNLGVVELRAGRIAHAIRELEAAQRLDPSAPHARELLAQARALHAAASRFALEHRAALDTLSDAAVLRQLEAACLALDDVACATQARARLAATSEPRAN